MISATRGVSWRREIFLHEASWIPEVCIFAVCTAKSVPAEQLLAGGDARALERGVAYARIDSRRTERRSTKRCVAQTHRVERSVCAQSSSLQPCHRDRACCSIATSTSTSAPSVLPARVPDRSDCACRMSSSASDAQTVASAASMTIASDVGGLRC